MLYEVITTFDVAGIATVTAGWETTNFRNSCAQLAQSYSAAQAGSGCRPSARNRRPPWNGRLTITAMPRSAARGVITSYSIHYTKLYERGLVDEGLSLREAARQLGVEIESICAENATIGCDRNWMLPKRRDTS